MEGPDKEISFTPEGKKAIFSKLVEAEGLEKFIDVKYTGTKRFGLDGAESIVPALEQIIKRGGSLGVKEIVIGMPHRGRLNVLTNVMSKPFRALFSEFKGGAAHPDTVEGSGDVKYHLGTSSDREFDGNKVHLSLTANPSHLEAVDPVVLGKARAKRDTYKLENGKSDRSSVILLLHGARRLPVRASWRNVLAFPVLSGTNPAGRSTLLLTIKLALQPIRGFRVPHLTLRCCENGRGADFPCKW